MDIFLKIILYCLYSVFVILSITLFYVDVDESIYIAGFMLLIIPSWVAFGAIALFIISSSIPSLFKEQGSPAFVTSVFSVHAIEKIASYEKTLYLISQICFYLWSFFFLASIFAKTS